MNKLSILTLIFAGLLLLSVITKRAMSESYDVSCEKFATEFANKSYKLQFVELPAMPEILKNNEQYQVVDLRSKEEFNKAHLENAINLPVEIIQQNQSLSDLDTDKTLILYSTNYDLASNVQSYLKQIGFNDVKYLQANFIDAQKYMKNPVNYNPRLVNKEIAKYNYKLFFNQTKKVKPITSAPKTKVKRASGGC